MDENLRNEIAAFRFGLIAQVVQRKLNAGEKYNLLKEIAAQRYSIPGSEKTTISLRSLERYLKNYEKDGFDALKPQKREKGKSSICGPLYIETSCGIKKRTS
nr:hypothetical protein [Anaerobacillus isosaccharinicus]